MNMPEQFFRGSQMDISANTAAMAGKPGKSGQSVGHLAKAAVAEARANGVDLPKNAQGMAASAIAQGADPASVFAALVPPPEPVSDPDAVTDTAPDTAPGDVTDVAPAEEAPLDVNVDPETPDPILQLAEDAYADAASATMPPASGLTSAEAALELLT